MSLLEIEDLRTGYGALPVLQGISFSVEEGETAVLFGLNGAGKTTTINTLAGLHPVWSYCHVPAGSDRDVTATITRRIERYAPGFADTVVTTHVRTAARLSVDNPVHVGGDVAVGEATVWQTLARPVPRLDPYATPLPGVFLCSSATPPGPGVHGMGGVHAARSALRSIGLRRRG